LPNDGLGLIYAIAILVLLFLTLVNNVGIFIYTEIGHKKNKSIDDN